MKKIPCLFLLLFFLKTPVIAGPFHDAILDFETGITSKQVHSLETFTRLAQEHENLLAREYVFRFFSKWEKVQDASKPKPNEIQAGLIKSRKKDMRDLAFASDWVEASWIHGCLTSKSYPGKTSEKSIKQSLLADQQNLKYLGARGLSLHNGFSNFSAFVRGNFFILSNEDFKNEFFIVQDNTELYHPEVTEKIKSAGHPPFLPPSDFKKCVETCAQENFHEPIVFADIANFLFTRYSLIQSCKLNSPTTACQLTPSHIPLHVAKGFLYFFAMCGNEVAQKKLVLDFIEREDFPNAHPWLDYFASKKWSQAIYTRGICFFYGLSCSQDTVKGLNDIKEAASLGLLDAHAFLAEYFLTIEGHEQSIYHCNKIIQKEGLSKSYKAQAHSALGKVYLSMENTKQNNQNAFNHLKKAIQFESDRANFDLALMYFLGRHPTTTKPNFKMALLCAERQKRKDARSKYFVANMMILDTDNPDKYDDAYALLCTIQSDIPEAKLLLGELLLLNLCSEKVRKNAPRPEEIFSSLLSLDDISPHLYRSALFYKGEILINSPTQQHHTEGMKLIRKAANLGDTSAISLLAHLEALKKREAKAQAEPIALDDSSEAEKEVIIEWDELESDSDDSNHSDEHDGSPTPVKKDDQGSDCTDAISYTTRVPNDAHFPQKAELSNSFAEEKKVHLSQRTFTFFESLFRKDDLIKYEMSDAIQAFSELNGKLDNTEITTPKTKSNSTKIKFENTKTSHTHVLTMHNPHGKGKGLHRNLGRRMRLFLAAMGVDLESITSK